MVVSVSDFDVVSVPIDTPVANDAETDTVFAPLSLWVTVLLAVPNSCADVDVVNVFVPE